MSACETIPGGLPLPLDRLSSTDRHWRGRLQEGGTDDSIMLSAANDDSIADFWKSAVENYTSLDLTKQYDKRMAVWGIAKICRDNLREAYVAGLWEFALEEQLAWRVADHTTAKKPDELAINPSWSWASVKGKILVQDRFEHQFRDYRVTDHTGEPVSFHSDDLNARPKLPRKSSEDPKEEVANMGKELELVEERRRKSSATSRQGSQVGFSDVISYRLGSIGSSQSAPFGAQTMSPQPTGVIGRYTGDSKIHDHLSWYRVASELPRAILSWLTRPIYAQTQQVEPLREQNPQRSTKNTRDTEPELTDMRLAIRGYIHQGVMKRQDGSGGWMLVSASEDKAFQDTLIEAFPDLTPGSEEEATHFIVLALSRRADDDDYFMQSPDESPAPSWYVGRGIMVRPFGGERGHCRCYVRTGALNIRYLGERAWEHFKNADGSREGMTRDLRDIGASKFFLL
jgi:hypothetical protein